MPSFNYQVVINPTVRFSHWKSRCIY